jgi:molecular chaperone GrpE
MPESQKPTEATADAPSQPPPSGADRGPARRTDAPSDEDAAAESGEKEAAAPADPLAESRAEAGRLKEAWMRTAADFDNFRKRARRELEDARKAGREELLRDLLPVFDNLERGIQSAAQAVDVKAVTDGLHMILKQFDSTLARTGIQRVPEKPPGTVVAEVQPGYMAGDRLIRAAMVVVAKPKAGDAASGGDGAN